MNLKPGDTIILDFIGEERVISIIKKLKKDSYKLTFTNGNYTIINESESDDAIQVSKKVKITDADRSINIGKRRSVKATDLEIEKSLKENVITYFPNATEAAKFLRITKPYLFNIISSGQLYRKKYSIEYY